MAVGAGYSEINAAKAAKEEIVANILDYLEWRGDLPLERVPLCEVDRLILCRLAYMPFGGVVPEDASRPAVALGDAA